MPGFAAELSSRPFDFAATLTNIHAPFILGQKLLTRSRVAALQFDDTFLAGRSSHCRNGLREPVADEATSRAYGVFAPANTGLVAESREVASDPRNALYEPVVQVGQLGA